jgi:HD-GYP domain-containing protein (c-di-GMP phosphodiesterase class II)
VKHHHEREDGSGYPSGLVGDQIPIGARIVAVCDAVDAMLSDRPYRSALSVPDVLQQLREHTGSQFAPRVVDALVGSDIISEYADIMRASRSPANRPDLMEEMRPGIRPEASPRRRYGLGRLSQGAS